MILKKKTYFLLIIVFLLITLASFFLYMNKPKVNKYTRAKLVYDHVVMNYVGG
jgi:flagellar biosynthesis/type III secretory pathway M-ring protein FliF/YscJ